MVSIMSKRLETGIQKCEICQLIMIILSMTSWSLESLKVIVRRKNVVA